MTGRRPTAEESLAKFAKTAAASQSSAVSSAASSASAAGSKTTTAKVKKAGANNPHHEVSSQERRLAVADRSRMYPTRKTSRPWSGSLLKPSASSPLTCPLLSAPSSTPPLKMPMLLFVLPSLRSPPPLQRRRTTTPASSTSSRRSLSRTAEQTIAFDHRHDGISKCRQTLTQQK